MATIAEIVGVPLYIVHVDSIDALKVIEKFRDRGQRIIGEVLVAGLTLDDSIYYHKDKNHAIKYVMSPVKIEFNYSLLDLKSIKII
jgi:dihydropyrimidinase